MTIQLGQYIANLYADHDGFTDQDRDTIQRHLEEVYRANPDTAQKKAEFIQRAVGDGVIDSYEVKRLRYEFQGLVGKKHVQAHLSPLTDDNGQKLWKRQFNFMQKHFAVYQEGGGHHMDRASLRMNVQGIPLLVGSAADFYQSGRIGKCVLGEDTLVGEYYFQKGTTLELYENGRALAGTLSGYYGELPNGSYVRFDSKGGILGAVLGASATIQGHHFPKGTRIVYRSEGSLSEVILGGSAKIESRKYRLGERIKFDEYNEVIRG